MAVAYDDKLAAYADWPKMKGLADEDGVDWSLTHAYYANMGGFVIEKKSEPMIEDETETKDEPEIVNEYNLHHLSVRDIYILRKEGCIKELPNMTERELKDKSKTDSFVRVISIIQIFWSAAQIVVRSARKLPICPLELTVVAFTACAVVIYELYWKKPKSIGVSTTIARTKSYAKILETLSGKKETFKLGGGYYYNNELESDEYYNIGPLLPSKKSPVGGLPMRIGTVRKGDKFDDPTLVALLVGMVYAVACSAGCAVIPLVVVSWDIAKVYLNNFSLVRLLEHCGNILNDTGLLKP
ncbi:hypothetical protein ACHAQJ_010405 [Trichoderma viride]